jgi:uncharacterized protein YndB with AHSA1/START domain
MTAATQTTALHETIRMERTYNATPARVFEAWRDPKARERWSRPSPDFEVVYDQTEFKEGGLDIVRCGGKRDLRFFAPVRYLEIVPDARIIMAESMADNGKFRAASLVTIEFEEKGKATLLKVTLQVSAFDGPEMHDGYRSGWNAVLDNLASEFK